MINRRLYRPNDPGLVSLRRKARALVAAYNASSPHAQRKRDRLLKRLFSEVGSDVELEPPFHCDYGTNVRIGNHVYINAGCIILDCAHVCIGSYVKMGPAVQLYAATHPTDSQLRREGYEFAEPISIADGVWIGGGSIVLPGISVGENTVVGAGSVVTRDLPPNVIAAGNPCRVLRTLRPESRAAESS
jgi:maltose O-acetyltransferase